MAIRILFTLAGASLLSAIGCGGNYMDTEWTPAHNSGPDPAVHLVATATTAPTASAEPTGVLTLRQAVAAALLHNPELASLSYSARSAEAGILQAGLPPNPELGLEVENFGGSGAVRALAVAETTVSLSQVIELGGKLSKRTQAARMAADVANWDYQVKRIDVLTEVAQRFIDVAAAQRRIELARQSVELADQVLRAVAERVKAGKVQPVEQTKSRVLLATNRSALERGRRQLLTARQRLAATWGSTRPAFDAVSGDIQRLTSIPPRETLLARLSQNPQMARWASEIALRRAELALAKAKSVPDLRVSAGVRQFAETDDLAAVAGISLPIPILDRNQGDVRRARYDMLKTMAEREAFQTRVRAMLEEAYQNLSTAHETAITLSNEVLPAAEEAFAATHASYTEGKLPYIDVLDAQRTLFDVRGQHIDALVECHRATAEVERLVGQPLDAPGEQTIEGPRNVIKHDHNHDTQGELK